MDKILRGSKLGLVVAACDISEPDTTYILPPMPSNSHGYDGPGGGQLWSWDTNPCSPYMQRVGISLRQTHLLGYLRVQRRFERS